MRPFNPISSLFWCSDRANALVLDAARSLTDAQLDQPFGMGLGTLRRTLLHIHAGELVWLQRWQGHIETRWPDESEPASVKTIADRLASVWQQRDAFLGPRAPESMAKVQMYRDSKGSMFRAPLGDMILQMFAHSAHHRAQAVNMLRHLGVEPPQVDYMMLVREPA